MVDGGPRDGAGGLYLQAGRGRGGGGRDSRIGGSEIAVRWAPAVLGVRVCAGDGSAAVGTQFFTQSNTCCGGNPADPGRQKLRQTRCAAARPVRRRLPSVNAAMCGSKSKTGVGGKSWQTGPGRRLG